MTNDELRSLEAQADAYQAQADEDRRNAPYRKIKELERKLQAAEAALTWAMKQIRAPKRRPGQNDNYCAAYQAALAVLALQKGGDQ